MANTTPNPNRWDHLQGKVRFGVCQVCLNHVPEDNLRYQDGIVVCPDHWEPNGRDITRDRVRSEASATAAGIASKAQTPRYPFADGIFKANVGAAVPAVTDISPEPIVLSRGGPAVTGSLIGVNLTASDVIAYSNAEITNSVAPVVTPSLVTIEVQASVNCPLGFHDLDYNLQKFRSIFKVV